ncbi:alanine-zipper protein [Plasticicumulans acidivorans]|uniref:Uncharacterized protein DUF3359 n=1 Tax=Plasticicumulans acidivorans TaxID=886464 RepID=A0A317N2M3_9GAMM|nr:alanine-zipper protein [Plasticicumulans acidivorans]PWV64387.1 uncharacterized protein DUF3359 [Plasticicumulans acidivorans]
MKTVIKLSALAAVAALSVGCASTGDVEAVRAEAQKAQATANQALSTANEAKAIATDTSEKLNRMFKKSMYK